MIPEAEAYFRNKVHNPGTLARVLAANQGIREGDCIRGHWRPSADWAQQCMCRVLVRKGAFIRHYGRAAWELVPKQEIRRQGRRMAAPMRLGMQLKGVPAHQRARARALLAAEYPGDGRRMFHVEHIAEWAEIFRA